MNLKLKIRKSLIPQWKIGKELGVSEQTIVRWLRVPEDLEKDKVTQIEEALDKLMKEER